MKLRIFLIIYTIIASLNVYIVLFDKNGYNTFGSAILICGLAAIAALILLIAIFWNSKHRRRYFWALLWVCLPVLSIWAKEWYSYLFNKQENIEVQLKELPLK